MMKMQDLSAKNLGNWKKFNRPIGVKFTLEGEYIRGMCLAFRIMYTNPRDAFEAPEIDHIAYLMDDGQVVECPEEIEWYE